LGGRGRWISEFQASLVYLQSELQDSQSYTEKPCLEKQKQKKQKTKNKKPNKQKKINELKKKINKVK
jgi:Sec-independent protein translocase protein TatA